MNKGKKIVHTNRIRIRRINHELEVKKETSKGADTINVTTLFLREIGEYRLQGTTINITKNMSSYFKLTEIAKHKLSNVK